MNLEKILLIIGIIGILTSIGMLVKLIVSYKTSKLYKNIIETEETQALTTSYFKTDMTIDSVQNVSETTEVMSEVTQLMTEIREHTPTIEKIKVSDQHYISEILENKYRIIGEIHGGGMSKVYLAENIQLGNKWIVKFVHKKEAEMIKEEEILKKLNHISLPTIIDLFYHETGTYIVESYIEGITLDKIIQMQETITQQTIIDWGSQLNEVLLYLHHLQPSAIIHRDLKPKNIMVTHNNKLVLIDFGIAKEDITGKEIKAATRYYAAPEQYQGNSDVRSDIYSLGVILFELATGQKPVEDNHSYLAEVVSKELNDLILKCLKLHPDERYQTTIELQEAFEKIKKHKIRMAETMVKRKLLRIATAISFGVSSTSLMASSYIGYQENLSIVEVDTNVLTLSEQQSSQIVITQTYKNGKVKTIKPSQIQWIHEEGDIVKVDGDRVIGLNEGTTEILGKYRNKVIALRVEVIKQIEDEVEVSLKYDPEYKIDTFTGNGEREIVDANIKEASFVSPQNITQGDDDSIYIVDSNVIRKIKDNQVETIQLQPEYITPYKIKTFEDNLYILTNEWQDEEDLIYGMIRLNSTGAEMIYLVDAMYTNIPDFEIDQQGNIYFIEYNAVGEYTELRKIDTKINELEIVCDLPKDAVALAINEKDEFYIGCKESATIQSVNPVTGELRYVAGIEGERHFIDGIGAHFYNIQQMKAAGEDLYVLDFNVLRKITLRDGIVYDVETVAGQVSTKRDVKTLDGLASEVILEKNELRDFEVIGNTIYITDPDKSVIRKITR